MDLEVLVNKLELTINSLKRVHGKGLITDSEYKKALRTLAEQADYTTCTISSSLDTIDEVLQKFAVTLNKFNISYGSRDA